MVAPNAIVSPHYMDHRRHPRFPVRFRSSFSSVNIVSGSGIVQDLSLFGCKILSETPVRPGTGMELHVEIADHGSFLRISQAVVRWVRHGMFGLEFIDIGETDWSTLQQLIKELGKEPYQRQDEEPRERHSGSTASSHAIFG
ncbi:MAG: PilZ domain-containing protein [Nitrospira sp.]|nr:PilZ domain-containing protein [Nitrospira sp.]